VVTSRYSDEERARIMAEARALLDEDADAEPRPSWPVRVTAIEGARSCARADRLIAEAEETKRMLEQGRQERKREEQRIIRERDARQMREWVDQRIADALAAHGFNELQTGALGMFIAEERKAMSKELTEAINALRAEIAARTVKEASEVVTLPNWRGRDVA
jgi:hypothetical protein